MAATNIPEHFKNKTFFVKSLFHGVAFNIREEHYPNGRLCIRLCTTNTPPTDYGTITTNLLDDDPGKHAFFVQDRFNPDLFSALLASGVFIDVRHPRHTAWKFASGRATSFENGEALEDELVLIEGGSQRMPAKNVPLGVSAWRLNQIGLPRGEKYLGRRLQEAPICPYCGTASEHVDGDVVYPHRPELADKKFWLCRPCDAYVGCHPGTPEPLGRLANAELRKAKMEAHTAFDKLWKGDQAQMRRADAYKWLAAELGIGVDDCHIGMFDLDACKKVIEATTQRLREAT